MITIIIYKVIRYVCKINFTLLKDIDSLCYITSTSRISLLLHETEGKARGDIDDLLDGIDIKDKFN